MNELIQKGKAAKKASYLLTGKTSQQKNAALNKIAQKLIENKDFIIHENKKDLHSGRQKGFSASILDRIMLSEKRIEDMAAAIDLLIEMDDPIGEVLETIHKDDGLLIKKCRIAIGVIGMIYEARPNVTVDAAALCLKTGNAVILRGSSSAAHSNMALVKVIQDALNETDIPSYAVQLIEDSSRKTAAEFFQLREYLDVLIPRGGKKLIDTVIKESSVPVIETGAGNCHIFIDETAEENMAVRILVNGKTQRPSVCNSIESVLIQKEWFERHGRNLLYILHEKEIEIYGDETVCAAFTEAKQAEEEDWSTEYLALKLSIKTVENVDEAIQHINKYGTKHSEAIITENEKHAEKFLSLVDAAAVYHNASTRFTDGFEFGYGAEIGISTQKLHARGPMGLPALTTTKYFIYGNGHIRD
ncbi:glutamate-5-semialdehyde dehydrogenase [Bacillus sp. OV322]|uniref:glutamate-5-semialdehyde dehydrogenase n=1 Tax=Bacillus sp. OV322 TaxID=1882764 RepID=UPI0008E6C1C3|nr:glutamate-5-semialdehyde dehydrogenase [Bacillus sp. OV322]SFC64773.1 glutamate-5-semialdehyde dehydrogenase [Bacillus sp. OV322]